MANPLDQVTEDRRDDSGNPLRRVYVFGDNDQAVGDPMGGGNALSAISQPAAQQWTMEDLQKGLAALKDYVQNGQFSPGTKIGNRMFGTGSEERYQMWPEKMVRSALAAPGEALASTADNPVTSENAVAPAQDMAGLVSGSTLFNKPGSATLGSGLTRSGAPMTEATAAPVFYSALEHAATNAAQDVMSPQQWLGFLKNQPGVKAEELAWTGLPEWLGAQKGKVSKQDVKAYLDEHKVEIKDVTKHGEEATGEWSDRDMSSAEQYASAAMREEFNRLPAVERAKYEGVDDWVMAEGNDHLMDRHSEIVHEWLDENARQTEGEHAPKYSSYQLPGGENYREHLLTMPNPKQERLLELEKRYNGGDRLSLEERQERHELIQQGKGSSYSSSHWDEPNVLAHVRTNDRIFPGTEPDPRYKAIGDRIEKQGVDSVTPEERALYNELDAYQGNKPVRSLHIEEIQSDWHQQGRKQGYKGSTNTEGWKGEWDPELKTWVVYDKDGKQITLPGGGGTRAADRRKGTEQEAIERAKSEIESSFKVPDAPFKTSWPELALKRMIRKASEEGYDRISWTPGEAQAARYDLSKSLETMSVFRHGDNKYSIVGDLKNGTREHNFGSDIPEAKLPDLIGKEMAEKIIKNKENQQDYKNPDLKVGGEGMREFYDKMLPKMAEKIGKAHGVKMQKGELPVAGDVGDFTGPVNSVPPSRIYDATPRLREQFPTKADFVDYYNDLTTTKRGELIAEAQKQGGRKTPIWYFDLPESLRHHAVGRGFPLYMSGIPFPLVPVDHDPFRKKEK